MNEKQKKKAPAATEAKKKDLIKPEINYDFLIDLAYSDIPKPFWSGVDKIVDEYFSVCKAPTFEMRCFEFGLTRASPQNRKADN